MKKQVLFMVVLLAAVGLLAGVAASSAFANSAGTPCPAGRLPRHGGAGSGRDSRHRTTGRLPPTASRPPRAFQWAVFKNERTRRHLRRALTGHGPSATPRRPVASPCPWERPIPIYAIYGPGVWRRERCSGQLSAPQARRTTPSRRRAGANGTISPAWRADRRIRRQRHVHDHARGRLQGRRRPRRQRLGGRRHHVHVHQRDGEPHHRGLVRAQDAPCPSPSRPTAGANGTITPPGPRRPSRPALTSPSRSQPATGYYVDTLKVDGTAVQPVTSYTFTNVTRRITASRRPSLRRPRCAPSRRPSSAATAARSCRSSRSSRCPRLPASPTTSFRTPASTSTRSPSTVGLSPLDRRRLVHVRERRPEHHRAR